MYAFGLAFQRADSEVVVARRERDQEICVRLLLNRDGLRVECRNCRRKKDCGISRFEGYRQIVDNKFIQGLLNDFARCERLDKEPEYKEDTDMKLTAAYKQMGDWWAAWVEEIPGVNTQGKTLEEARENLKDALRMVVEAKRELSEKEHEPTRREELVFA
jgi:predicted RNase H-like HicB family nuclease